MTLEGEYYRDIIYHLECCHDGRNPHDIGRRILRGQS